jgi:hypothetical protein
LKFFRHIQRNFTTNYSWNTKKGTIIWFVH